MIHGLWVIVHSTLTSYHSTILQDISNRHLLDYIICGGMGWITHGHKEECYGYHTDWDIMNWHTLVFFSQICMTNIPPFDRRCVLPKRTLVVRILFFSVLHIPLPWKIYLALCLWKNPINKPSGHQILKNFPIPSVCKNCRMLY